MPSRPSASELLAWTLLGAALGVAAGFALGEWIGPLTPSRAGRALAEAKRGGGRGPRLNASETARAARRALAGDAQLGQLGLEAVAVGAGVVEPAWLGARPHPPRPAPAEWLRAFPGIDSLVNCLLVRGEDDAATPA